MGWEFLVFALVMMVASYAITSLTAVRPQGTKPEVVKSLDFPQFEEGTPQAVVFGDCWTADWMILSTSDFQVEAITTTAKGKK
jgi:hypothetical protein